MLYESSYYGICDLGYDQSISHHGIKGQKWGIRRYQNADGTLTAEGKKRYGTVENLQKSQKRKKAAVASVAAIGAIVGTAVLAKRIKGTSSSLAPFDKKGNPVDHYKNVVPKSKRTNSALSKLKSMSDDDLLERL